MVYTVSLQRQLWPASLTAGCNISPFSYLYSWWLNLTLISVIYVDLLLKICAICSLPDRQSQYNVSFFPLTFVVPVLLGLHPGSIVWNRCLLLILIYLSPPRCTRSKSVYRACAGGRVCVCAWVIVCVCMCWDDVSFTVWVKTDVLKTDYVRNTDTVKRHCETLC